MPNCITPPVDVFSGSAVRRLIAVCTPKADGRSPAGNLAEEKVRRNKPIASTGHKTASQMLASPESFAAIGDVDKRSAAVFTELGKVLPNPRCVNCHPAGV